MSDVGAAVCVDRRGFRHARVTLGLPVRWVAATLNCSTPRLFAAESGLLDLPSGAWELLERMQTEANVLTAEAVETARDSAPASMDVYVLDRSFWAAHRRYANARVPASFHRAVITRLKRDLGTGTVVDSTQCGTAILNSSTGHGCQFLDHSHVASLREMHLIGPEPIAVFLMRMQVW
jgi:hypothetical protein